MARPQEVGLGVWAVHAAAAVAGSLQRHQRGLLPAAGPALRHHHLPHLQVCRPGRAEVRRGTPLQVRPNPLLNFTCPYLLCERID